MSDFTVTQEKINALVAELRSWESLEEGRTLHQLARMFGLELFIVDRVARSEGLHIKAGYRPEEEDNGVDPNATTLDLDPGDVHKALDAPDPNPEWEDRDDEGDTGVWRKKPTGEWERIDKG